MFTARARRHVFPLSAGKRAAGPVFIKNRVRVCHHPAMQEIELKLQVPAARRDAVARDVAGRTAVSALRLQAAYVDTPDRALASAGLALRVRREGRRWVQTLKGAGSDGITRFEHNVPRPGIASALPTVDPALHAHTAGGQRLLEVLEAAPDATLACIYRTDIRRRARLRRGCDPRG